MAKTTSSERNKAYRARHAADPAFRERERARVRAWRQERRAAGLPTRHVRTLGTGAKQVQNRSAARLPGVAVAQYAPPRFREMWEGAD